MEKLNELFKKVLEKLKTVMQVLSGKDKMKTLESENYYIFKILSSEVNDEIEMQNNMMQDSIYLGKVQSAVFEVGGLQLPIGSFEINGNNIDIKEQVKITPEGKMYMRGKEICYNENIQKEVSRQIQQNGKPTQVRINGNGEIIKTDSEKYRNEMYDDAARKRTEKVAEDWKEKQEEREQEHSKEVENEK